MGIVVLDDQALVVEAETGADGQFRRVRTAMVVQGLVAAAERRVGERLGDVGGGARRQLDRAAQTLGVMIRHAGIGDDDAVDGAGRNGVVFDGAAAGAGRRAARIGVKQGHAPIGGAVQVGVDAADLDEAAFTGVARQRDARHAAQRLGGVEIGVFGDGFGRLDADQVGRVLLDLPGFDFLARRGRNDHDLIDGRRGLRRGRRRGVLCHGSAGKRQKAAGRH